MTDDFPTGQYNLRYTTHPEDGRGPCELCAFMDGYVFLPGTEIYLPMHDHCRCRYTPTTAPPSEIPDWFTLPDAILLAWIAFVARRLLDDLPIPPFLQPLVDEAEAYNRNRKEQDPMPPDLDLSAPNSDSPNPESRFDESPITLSAPLQLAAGPGRQQFSVRFIRAGRIVTGSGEPGPFTIPAAAIQAALDLGMFDGLACFVDHPGWLDSNHSLRNLAAVSTSSEWNGADQSADGTVKLYDSEPGRIVGDLFAGILEDLAAGDPVPDVGMSLTFYAKWKPRDNYDEPRVLSAFRKILSADFVFTPAADGRVKEALEALSAAMSPSLGPAGGHAGAGTGPKPLGPPERQALDGQRPNPGSPNPGSRLLHSNEGGDPPPTDVVRSVPLGPPGRAELAGSRPNRPTNPIHRTQEGNAMPPDNETPNDVPIADVPQSPVGAGLAPAPSQGLSGNGNAATPDDWLRSLAQSASDTLISASGLPAPMQSQLRAQAFATPEQLNAAIDAHRQLLADLQQDDVVQVGNVPPRGGAVTLGRTGLDKVTAALDALVSGVQPPTGVQPLTGMRELYHILSGDYEMHGLYQPDRVYLANVNSSTMAALVANAMNKRVMNLFQEYPQWWAPAVTIEDFATLQDVRWITLGGVGELPTVAEGAAYTELTWDDQTETDSFVKKGGYLGLTLEAIDKDDTTRLRAAPRALAQSAWLTLGKAVAAIFTSASGLGPTMADTGTLFNATAVTSTGGHANLLTTALSWSQWNTVKVAMMKQAELNSGERLGVLTRPYLLWVPIDLETTALQILASEGEPGTADNDVNPDAMGNDRETRLANARKRLVVCPLWTDANNWAAQADPRLYPSIGLGFRYGRVPEIFSVASPTAGLMFTNDTLPVKVRFIFAVGPIDWRGLHKSNVA